MPNAPGAADMAERRGLAPAGDGGRNAERRETSEMPELRGRRNAGKAECGGPWRESAPAESFPPNLACRIFAAGPYRIPLKRPVLPDVRCGYGSFPASFPLRPLPPQSFPEPAGTEERPCGPGPVCWLHFCNMSFCGPESSVCACQTAFLSLVCGFCRCLS